MTATETVKLRFGEIAVKQKFITADQLERALAEQAQSAMRIGDLLVHLGFMSQAQATAIARFQSVLASDLPFEDEMVGRIFGNCLILELAGAGAGGKTFKAHHLNLDREVAIKVLNERSLGDPRVVERFRREAKAIARLNHPSIVAVYDFQDKEDGPFLILEYVDGRSLRELLDQQGPLSPRAVVWTALKLTGALAAAHSKGIVHRDIKPDNILISRKREVKLTDFGVVRFSESESTLSQPGELFGTPAYMAPEQLRGLPDIDHRADYYALGIVMFEMLVGRRPFESHEVSSLLHDQAARPLPDLRRLRPETPLELIQVIEDLCRKDRAERLADPGLLTARLHDLVSHWTSLPAIFPGVTGKLPRRDDLNAESEAEALVEQAIKGPTGKVLRELIRDRSRHTAEVSHRLAERLSAEDRSQDLIDLHAELIVGAPENERVHMLLGQAYRKARRLDEALTCFRAAHLLDRDSIRAALEVARVLLATGRREDATFLARQLIHEQPDSPTVLERVGEFFHMEVGDDDLALEAYRKALQGKTDRWPLLQRIGWIELERGDPQAAQEALVEATQTAPEPAFSLKLLARAYEQQHRFQEALESLTHSLRLDPQDLEARLDIIAIHKAQGRHDEVLELAKKGLEIHAGDEALGVERGEAHLALDEPERAARVFRKLLRDHPSSERAKLGLVAAQRARPRPS